MIYLASPYSDPDLMVRQQRFLMVCREAANLMRQGEMVYSPIAHGHCISRCGLPFDADYWDAHSRLMLARCESLAVLRLDGWETSVGVQREIELAKTMGIPIRHLVPRENAPAGAEA